MGVGKFSKCSFFAHMHVLGLPGYHAMCLPVHIVIMQHVLPFRGVMIEKGNEPRWEQGGAQSGAAETCLPSGTERQTFVWQGDSPTRVHLTPTSPRLTSLTPSFPSQTLRDTASVSTTLTSALSLCLTLSPSSFLLTELSSFIILSVSAFPLF